jgi:hypothetical protein
VSPALSTPGLLPAWVPLVIGACGRSMTRNYISSLPAVPSPNSRLILILTLLLVTLVGVRGSMILMPTCPLSATLTRTNKVSKKLFSPALVRW